MFVFANFISATATVLDSLLRIYFWIVMIRTLLSWVSPDPYNPIVQFLYRVTEPIFAPIRRRIGYGMGLDFSPVIVILGILFLQQFLVRSLMQVAVRLR